MCPCREAASPGERPAAVRGGGRQVAAQCGATGRHVVAGPSGAAAPSSPLTLVLFVVPPPCPLVFLLCSPLKAEMSPNTK